MGVQYGRGVRKNFALNVGLDGVQGLDGGEDDSIGLSVEVKDDNGAVLDITSIPILFQAESASGETIVKSLANGIIVDGPNGLVTVQFLKADALAMQPGRSMEYRLKIQLNGLTEPLNYGRISFTKWGVLD